MFASKLVCNKYDTHYASIKTVDVVYDLTRSLLKRKLAHPWLQLTRMNLFKVFVPSCQ